MPSHIKMKLKLKKAAKKHNDRNPMAEVFERVRKIPEKTADLYKEFSLKKLELAVTGN